jgi:hypothetical protein
MPTKSVILGPEYDQNLRAVLMAVLRSMCAIADDRTWGVGGSQEFESIEVRVRGKPLAIEAETYIGLSIRGESEMVDEVAEQVLAKWSPGK